MGQADFLHAVTNSGKAKAISIVCEYSVWVEVVKNGPLKSVVSQ